jgi:hypothetical protein
MRRLAFTAFLLLLTGIITVPQAMAQPADVDNPSADFGDPNGRPDIPTRIDDIMLPQIQFMFDRLLDPQQVTLIEQITGDSVNDPRLTEAARSVIRNHLIAMQQVEIAIQFLLANREEILAGRSPQFNQVFGNVGIKKDVAIVNPVPVGGVADVGTVAMNGNQLQLDFDDDGDTAPNVTGQLQAGDVIFVGDATTLPPDPDGFIVTVIDVQADDDGDNQIVITDLPSGGVPQGLNDRPVHVVLGFDQRGDPDRYDRVLQTFQAIQRGLSGLDPNDVTDDTVNNLEYNRDFTDINNVWAPGVAPFSALDPIVQRMMAGNGLDTSMVVADRLVRQAGLSTSDSHTHLDRLQDRATGQQADYQGNMTFPLLWTQDNELPLEFDSNQVRPGSTDFDRAFFRDRQTIFGEPDNVFTQYTGRAFFEETINHAGGFFDGDTVAIDDTLGEQSRIARRPQRSAQAADIDGDGTTPDFENSFLPESGTATVGETESRRWQMILESFAEHSTDLDQLNVAAVGVSQIFGGSIPDGFQARNAGSFARFAGLLGNGSALGGIDFSRIEPFGKRAVGGFFPIVPRN